MSIARYFRPLVTARPERFTMEQWLEYVIFHIHERVIKSYVTIEAFIMPGLFYWLPTKPIQGYGLRRVKLGTEIVVRTDSKAPQVVDVEAITKVRERARVFRLSPDEWKKVKKSLKEMEFKSPAEPYDGPRFPRKKKEETDAQA